VAYARELLYRTMLEVVPSFILVTDPHQKTLLVTPSCKALSGYTPEEIAANNTIWVDPFDLPKIRELIDTSFAEVSGHVNFRHRMRTKEGSVRYVSTSWRPVLDAKGAFVAMVAQIVDVHEQMIAQMALEISEQKYRMLVERTAEMIWETDAQTRFTYASERLIEYFGYTESEIIGKTPFDFMEPEEAARVIAEMADNVGRREPVAHVECCARVASGAYVYYEISSVPIFSDQGEYSGYRSVGHDVTPRKEMELVLRQSERRLQSLVAEKDLLLREINHRVKNNLEIISSLLYLQSGKTSDPVIRELFDDCRERIECIAGLHDRIYRSREQDAVAFDPLLREVILGVFGGHQQSSAHTRLHMNLGNTRMEARMAFPVALIANELITNVLKHAFPNRSGSVEVQFDRVPKSGWRLIIRDDGVGFQTPTNPNSFGLQLVEMLVAQLNGHMELTTNNGVCAIITIPEKVTL
jgi:PAS domain S-box-containing protein